MVVSSEGERGRVICRGSRTAENLIGEGFGKFTLGLLQCLRMRGGAQISDRPCFTHINFVRIFYIEVMCT